MLCPKCSTNLEVWQDHDQVVDGLSCPACEQKWYSKQIKKGIYEAQKKAVQDFLGAVSFPKDAVPEESYKDSSDLNLLIYYCECYQDCFKYENRIEIYSNLGHFFQQIQYYLDRLQKNNLLCDLKKLPSSEQIDFVNEIECRARKFKEEK